MEESIRRNLDTQRRMLDDLERAIDAELVNDVSLPVANSTPAGAKLNYDALTQQNEALRKERGWTEVDLDAGLTPGQRDQFSRWLKNRRLTWTQEDQLALGFAGAVAAAATIFDTTVDSRVTKALGMLHDTALFEGWERAGKRLPIDYTGKGVGGPSHRLRSAGHDLARPLEALRQIRDGQFRGTAWIHGQKVPIVESLSHFRGVDSISVAMVLWMKHLAADFVTPMSLPLPGFTLLWEFDDRTIARFAHAMYQGPGRPLGQGLNARSGLLTPSLTMLCIEAILRTHMLLRAYQRGGSLQLTEAEHALQTELLLAGHSIVGATMLGKSAFKLLLTRNPVCAIRHLNVPVLLRIATLAVSFDQDARRRSESAAPSWDVLLAKWAEPWQLDSAQQIEREAAALLS